MQPVLDHQPYSPHTTSNIAGWVLAIRDALRSYGHDASNLLARSGITTEDLQRANNRIAIEKINRLWQLIDTTTHDDAFALRVPRFIPVHAFQGFSFAVSSSDNVQDFLSRIARFSKVASTAADLHFTVHENFAQLQIDTSGSSPKPVDANVDAFAGVIVGTLSYLLDDPAARPSQVSFMRKPPNNRAAFERFFRCPIEFGAAENILRYDAKLLTRENPYRDAAVVAHNERAIREYLQRLQVSSISHRVHQTLATTIGNGVPTQIELAQLLDMSSRTLQRQLKQHNTSFQSILDKVRLELAKHYLQDSRQSITDIAYQLGYSDSSHFARAFKRWTDLSPKQYRQARA